MRFKQSAASTLRDQVGAWFQSLSAKLFLAMALLTTVLTIAIAISVFSSFSFSIESYTKDLALRTARGAIEEINRQDPSFKFRRETSEILVTWVNPENVNQIDIFAAAKVDGGEYVEVWATSNRRPESVLKDDAEILDAIGRAEERADLMILPNGQTIWRIYMPLQVASDGSAKMLLRAYCNFEHWHTVWKKTFQFALKALPAMLIVEFALIWILASAFLRRPMQKIMKAMRLLGEGDISARANLQGKGELGQISRHFDAMAADLQKISEEREKLLTEIQGFNATLQGRVDEALTELKEKNTDLEQLMRRNTLLREELGQQERMAVAGQLAAAFAHEVGTPLNLVDSHIQLLIGDPGIDDRTRLRLNTIHSQIERVGEIVKKLTDISRPSVPKRELMPIKPLLCELNQLWEPTFEARNVQFRAEIPADCSLSADRKQLEQLFINLVNNSLDAMPNGGRITLVATQNRPADWGFELHDTGSGLAPEAISKAFKPMFTTKPEGKGTGLGLAICREIVKSHGGEISIENAQGCGVIVKFTLPAQMDSK